MEEFSKDIRDEYPVDNSKLYISKLYFLLEKLDGAPEDEEVFDYIENYIYEKLEQINGMINKFANLPELLKSDSIYEDLIEGFYLYEEGLNRFMDYLMEGNEDYIYEAFNKTYEGDKLVVLVEDKINKDIDKSIISQIA